MTDKVELKKAMHYPNGNLMAVDYSGTINLLPREYGLVKQLGVFGERFGTQKQFFLGRKEDLESPLLEDRNWETTRPTLSREEQSGVLFKVPHFPVDDMILPSDVDGLFQMEGFGAGSELETVANVRAQKLAKIRRSHEITHEFARTKALVTGEVYAPTGTLKTSYGNTVNVYDEWGIVRATSQIDVVVGNNPLGSVSDLFGAMQDMGRMGDALDGFAVICDPLFFKALTTNEYITEIFAQVQLMGRQDLLVGRLGNSLGLDKRYRSFNYGGIEFIEYKGTVAGQALIPANTGIAIPLGTELGRLHFAPANKFNTINGVSQASYVWERMDDRQTKIELESETNFAAVLERPDLVRTVTLKTA